MVGSRQNTHDLIGMREFMSTHGTLTTYLQMTKVNNYGLP